MAFLLLLVLAPPLHARPKTDTVTLVNGDTVTGEIKRLDRGQLTYKTDAMSTVYVEWEDVVRISSNHMFRVRSKQGLLYFGTLGAKADSFTVSINSLQATVLLPADEVVDIVPLESNFWHGLDGSLSLGFSYTKASKVGQLSFSFAGNYQARRNYFDLQLSSITTTQENQDPSNTQSAAFAYNRELSLRKWFATGGVGAQRNDGLGLDLRLSLNGGLGIRIVHSNHNQLSTSAGLVINREFAADSSNATTNIEGRIELKYSLFRYSSPKSDINVGLILFPSLTNAGRLRMEFETKLRHELVSDFFLDLTFYYTRDNKPASAEASQDDYSIVASIGWSY